MPSSETITWWIWTLPIIIVLILLVVVVGLYILNRLRQTPLSAITNLQATYVSSDSTQKTQTWTVSWSGLLTPGVTYNYFLSKTQNYPGEIRLRPLPIGITGQTGEMSITFDNLPSASTYSFSIYATLGGLQSPSSSFTWCSTIEDGDIVYIYSNAGIMSLNYEMNSVFEGSVPQGGAPQSGNTAFVARATSAPSVFNFFNNLDGILSVDSTTFALDIDITTSLATQFNISYGNGGMVMQSQLTNQYVAFNGPADNQGRATAVANALAPETFTLSSTLYFGNDQATFFGFSQTGTYMQYPYGGATLPESIVPGDFTIAGIIGAGSNNPSDDNYTFYPILQSVINGIYVWSFLSGAEILQRAGVDAYVSITNGDEIGSLCVGDASAPSRALILRATSSGTNDPNALWIVQPITSTVFFLKSVSLETYASYCDECCSSTSTTVPSNIVDAQSSDTSAFTNMFSSLGIF